jgi:NitT/TauT family transport system permease protein
MTMVTQRGNAVRVIAPIVVGVVALTVWQVGVTAANIEAYLLPSPLSIVGETAQYGPSIVSGAAITGLNALVGLVLGSLLGIVGALLASASRFVDQLAAPLIAALAVVPIVALAPVLNTMYGADSQFARQAIAAIAVFIPVFVNTLRGLRQALPVHRDLMRAYAAPGLTVMRTVTLPTAVPFIFTGIRIGSSLAVISALVAEYFGGPRGGLGGLITTAASGSAYSRAWAYVLGAIALGLAFFLITLALERFATRRQR